MKEWSNSQNPIHFKIRQTFNMMKAGCLTANGIALLEVFHTDDANHVLDSKQLHAGLKRVFKIVSASYFECQTDDSNTHTEMLRCRYEHS